MAILEGTAYWASITTPNTTFEPVYTVNLVVDNETANDFASRGHTVKQMDEGPALIMKRKVNGPKGMVRPAPRLFDKDKQEVSTAVGNGSQVRVQFNEYDWEYAGKQGKGLDLQAVQIVNLVEYKNGDGDEFFSDGEEF
jgi:PKD repeat protein